MSVKSPSYKINYWENTNNASPVISNKSVAPIFFLRGEGVYHDTCVIASRRVGGAVGGLGLLIYVHGRGRARVCAQSAWLGAPTCAESSANCALLVAGGLISGSVAFPVLGCQVRTHYLRMIVRVLVWWIVCGARACMSVRVGDCCS